MMEKYEKLMDSNQTLSTKNILELIGYNSREVSLFPDLHSQNESRIKANTQDKAMKILHFNNKEERNLS